jgi:ABC-type branched-subunit amino acid transport system ATPase component
MRLDRLRLVNFRQHAATDIAFGPGITGIIGPNGAGKTTLFNLLSGTTKPDAGRILLNARDITALPAESRARLGMSRTFQLSRPFRNLTVRDHLLLSRRGDDDLFWKSFIRGSREDGEDAGLRRSLELVGLDVPFQAQAADLSYGQSKLLGIAMALTHPHRLLLLDEPVAGVNPVIRERIAALLRNLRAQGETMLVIEHDMQFVMQLADQVVVMDRGRVIAEGSPEAAQKDPDVLAAYLGEQL